VKILSPVDGPEEASRLADLGARELYGGFLSPRWAEDFSLAASANRRSFAEAQIPDEGSLREVVVAAHEKEAAFFLTVNSPFYIREQFPPLLEMLQQAVALGVDAIIAADVSLLLETKERWPTLPVHLSTMAEVTNSAAVAFYRRLGVRRVTLPRHLSTAEIGKIVAASPGTKFDVFVLYGQCANAEGLCTFSHDHPERRWPCVQPYTITPGDDAAGRREDRAPAACAQMLWDGLGRGEACGLCSLYDLRRLGIESVKIVGRGTGRERKEWAVRTARRLIDLLEGEDMGREEFCSEARRLYRERFPKGCRATLCYFPEYIGAAGD
jgi:putative protease